MATKERKNIKTHADEKPLFSLRSLVAKFPLS